jgi:hypothetical protein
MIAMTRLAAILFCFFLVYAGAAEAFKGCLGHDVHSDQHLDGHPYDSANSVTHDHSSRPSWPAIHCPTSEQRLGPALQVASTNLYRFDRVASFHSSFILEPGSPVSKNSLWLEALFKKILALSLPKDLARHLFLSILQI